MEGLMTRQALAATFQTLTAAGQGLGVLLQAQTRLVEQTVIHVQQLCEGSVVQFRVRSAPGAELFGQGVALAQQFVAALAATLLLAGEAGQFDSGLVELVLDIRLLLAGQLQCRVQLLLPISDAGLLAQVAAQALSTGFPLTFAFGKTLGAGLLLVP